MCPWVWIILFGANLWNLIIHHENHLRISKFLKSKIWIVNHLKLIGKSNFKDSNTDTRIFKLITNVYINTRRNFFLFCVFTMVPTNGPKNGLGLAKKIKKL